MLVLSRKPLQSIMIGPDIKITIVKVERNQVRIGIEAPRDVTILRDELIEHIAYRFQQRVRAVRTASRCLRPEPARPFGTATGHVMRLDYLLERCIRT